MAITVPVLFTPLQDAEVNYTRSTNEETIRKMVQDVNMQGKLAPIGTIRCVQLNQTGVQAPDSTIWQLCDGSEITNPNSPLRSQGLITRFAPDMLGRFPRGAATASVNNYGGAFTLSLGHSHGGQTGNTGGPVRGEEGDERTARVGHSHPISSSLGDLSLRPAHQVLSFYIKIT